MIGILKTFGRLGGIVALILMVIALLRQLILLVGVLLTIIKVAVIVAFVALFVMIALAILKDRARRKREAEDI